MVAFDVEPFEHQVPQQALRDRGTTPSGHAQLCVHGPKAGQRLFVHLIGSGARKAIGRASRFFKYDSLVACTSGSRVKQL